MPTPLVIVLTAASATLIAGPSAAQTRSPAALPSPSEQESGVLPSPAEFLGYDLGERFTDSGEIVRYFRSLADRSDRIIVREYGRTPEGRSLIQAVVTDASVLARLDDVLDANRELADPETTEERASELAEENPAVVYLTYGIHGDESSSPEAAMWTAWDLVSSRPPVAGVLESLVVVIDPVANPDGRDRYVNWYRSARSAEPDPDPASWEHRPPWPGGRYNHYLFDLNRDWAWATQPETLARLDTWDTWNPQVHVDFHEMGDESTYFFFPPTAPINPIYPEHVLTWGRRFGLANGAAFDRNGWLYFTGDTYDLFYPGYGDSWPSLLGSVGMTYEQAGSGSAGLVVRRDDGTLLTLRDRILHHRTAGHATLAEAARGRADLLRGFAETYRSVDEGLSDVLLVPSADYGRPEALVRFLEERDIRVEEATTSFQAEAVPHPGYGARRSFPEGTFLVRARQSRGRLASVLLRPDNTLDTAVTYDITAWSLPYAYGVEAHSVEDPPEGVWHGRPSGMATTIRNGRGPVSDEGASAGADDEGSAVGYLLPPRFDHLPPLLAFLEAGGRAVALEESIEIEGAAYPRGTVFLSRSANPALDSLLEQSGAAPGAVPVATSMTEEGPNLGSNSGRALRNPRIALVGGPGTEPTSFGAHWFFLERTLGADFDIVRSEDLSGRSLASYDAVLVPEVRGFEDALGPEGIMALDAWVGDGGTLIAVGEGARAVAESLADVGLREADEEVEAADGEDPDGLDPATEVRSERERRAAESRIQGAVVPLRVDPDHPLVFGATAPGTDARLFALSQGNAFEPSTEMETAVWYPGGVRQVSGRASADRMDELSLGAWLVQKRSGGGSYVLFADDPLFRHFWYTGFRLLSNALLLAGSE